MIYRQTSLSRNIVQFCRYLRQQSFTVGVEEEATALKSLQWIDCSTQQVFRLALKAVLCRSQIQLYEFEALFSEYWKETEKAIDSKIKTKTMPVLKSGINEASFKALKSWLNGNNHEMLEYTATYSTHRNLSGQDFSKVPADGLHEMMRIVKALSKRLAAQTNRRHEKSAKVNQPDLRKTLRKNMRHGGELMEIIFKKPKHNKLKLVILCDISKSMELYAVFLLQFMYSFRQVYNRIETFAFSTSLQCITPHLKNKDFVNALQDLSAQNNNWNGGTRIGESLHHFITTYASRLLGKRTVVIILSDGWDMGDTQLLRQSMEIIHNKSKKVIWLNPLAGYISYRPDVAGMQAALPYIDVFAPAHNADSLRNLNKLLY